MKIDQIISEVSKEDYQLQRKFAKLISSNITIGIRSINSYEELSDNEKNESISQLNQFQHQIINQTRVKFPEKLSRISDISIQINKQNSIAGKELVAIIKLAFETFKNKSPEQNFLDKIDCNFPYNDKIESSKLIAESLHYSPNATFTIIEEIARIPFSERKTVSTNRLRDLISEIDKLFEHPLKAKIIDVTLQMIEQKELQIENSLSLMNEIENDKGLWGALAIAYESCQDEENKLENKFDEIRDKWNGNKEADL